MSVEATIYFCYWVRGKEHAELAQLSIQSVRAVYGNRARITVFTDDAAPEWTIKGAMVSRLDPGRPAMVANLDAQVKMIGTVPYGSLVLFLDADVLLRKPFPWDEFDPEADLYVTWRDHVNGDKEAARHQPLNYGVLGALANVRTIEAFLWLRARILSMSPERQAWYGNQIALAELVTGYSQTSSRARVRWTDADTGTEITVCSLPCAIWNYSPDRDDENVDDKGVLHFKGGRKDLMLAYAGRCST